MWKDKRIYSKKKIMVSVAVIVIGLLYYLEIRTLGFTIPCMYHFITGWKCPGCGITGMALSILRGDLQTAFQRNMGLFFLSPVLVPLFLTCWHRWITNRSNNIKIINRIIVFCIVVLLIWTVFRNIYGY